MKYAIYSVCIILLVFSACGKNTVLNPNEPIDQDPTSITFGTDQTLDIVTWNILTFPRAETDRVALANMVTGIGADVIAFQEIMDYQAFYNLAATIPYYNAYVYSASAGTTYRLAYLYDTRTVTVNSQYTIYNYDSNPFPRPPYVLEITWQNQDYYIINNHLKAYGDNYIDESLYNDEEVRRRLACQKLDTYITTNLPNERVIVLGDMNDQIEEPRAYNVFLSFLDKPAEYLFADMPIALAPTYYNVSYPSYISHIDHILITNELFADFTAGGSYCRAILAENWFGSFSAYKVAISDHRPVGIRLAKR
jgi:endonuclease/exonuclease/phosphatase family metal-dependent hydrolase